MGVATRIPSFFFLIPLFLLDILAFSHYSYLSLMLARLKNIVNTYHKYYFLSDEWRKSWFLGILNPSIAV